jgi:hypothetical protein
MPGLGQCPAGELVGRTEEGLEDVRLEGHACWKPQPCPCSLWIIFFFLFIYLFIGGTGA